MKFVLTEQIMRTMKVALLAVSLPGAASLSFAQQATAPPAVLGDGAGAVSKRVDNTHQARYIEIGRERATLFINGQKVGENRIPVTEGGLFSADETADVGIDLGTPVVEAIGGEAKSRFTGRISRVTVEVK
jgi:hypothetical protein